MSILEQSPGLLDALRGEMTPKFLATRSPDGVPNVVPVITMLPSDDEPDTLFFGNFLLRKSILNLEQDLRVGIFVMTPDLRGWILIANFVAFEQTGPYFERQMSGPLLRYNAYTGIRNAGIIRVRSVESAFVISRLQVARDFALARLSALVRRTRSNGGTVLPLPVRREFGKMVAVKVMAWVDKDGYPMTAPLLSLQPAGAGTLVCWKGKQVAPPSGALVATNILTFDAVSYQAKGTWSVEGNRGAIQVQEVYAGGPPYPGGRVA